MDKLLEIVLAAVVISVTGMALLFVVNGQTGSFTDFMGNQSQGAQCDIKHTKWKDTVCSNPTEASDIMDEADAAGCDTSDWPTSVSC